MRLRTLAARKSLLAAAAVAAIAAIAVPLGALSSQAAEPPPPPTRVVDIVADAALALADDAAARAVALTPVDTVETAGLAVEMIRLVGSEALPVDVVVEYTDDLREATQSVDRAVDDAKARQAAAKAVAERRAEAKAKARAQARANTPAGAQSTARKLAATRYGWGDGQFSCLRSLWQRESGWNYRAHNSSGATGIPQALPGSKMASAGRDWKSSATTQIRWGLSYIERAYGSPCAAWGHSQGYGWY